ncbi:MAG: bifunctional DNA-binding transcriptional regulator/O6-methylguanine-DNA methyltransferase Ada [Gammaproteobacteria bacterium]|nr:bifunctional DNA-binding transcriptional regulator/O6-methylguanine-DNA methyltransferase Ada [Gammaproteobacteria bacterium]
MSTVFADRHATEQATAMPRFSTDAARWKAVRNRNPAADGHFLYAVRTTGVFCYPSCAARPALKENVAFHVSAADAERAGFRPCKRCRPDLPPRAEREAALVAVACRTMESADEPTRLAALAASAGLSPHHFHRIFKRIAGVTPKAYADAHRQQKIQDSLTAGSGVTEGLYAAGFNSSGRFYGVSAELLGMKPSAYRDGGHDEVIWHAVGACSLGTVLVAATPSGVCAILLGDDADSLVEELETRFPRATLSEPEPGFTDLVERVVAFVDNPSGTGNLGLPLDIRGTAFQRRVWEALQKIPAGKTASYKDIAVRIGSPKAVRAVAQACRSNALALAIPCHRVVRSDGGLSGYRWGIDRKRQLLSQERKHARE